MLLTDAIGELEAKIGGDAGLGPWLQMTPDCINDFTQATGDFQ